jgi:hypothetical protein
MSTIQIYKTSIPYEPTFIYPNVNENEVRLYNLFKTNCKDLSKKCVEENNNRFVMEMSLVRDFLGKHHIQFPLTTEQSINAKTKLEKLIVENSLDIMLLFIEHNTINLMFLSEEHNDNIIERAKLVLFHKNTIVAKTSL